DATCSDLGAGEPQAATWLAGISEGQEAIEPARLAGEVEKVIVDTHLKGEIIMTSNKSHGAHRILLVRTAVAKVPRRRNIMRRIYTNLLPIALFLFVV